MRTVTYLTPAVLVALAAFTANAQAQTQDGVTRSFEQLVATSPPPTIARITPDLGSITVQFNCNTKTRDDDIFAAPVIRATAQALLNPDLQKISFVLAYHTAAGDSEQADKADSEFCATAIRRVLVDRYRIASESLFHVGYGSSRPLNGRNKYAAENQRLEITNLGQILDQR